MLNYDAAYICNYELFVTKVCQRANSLTVNFEFKSAMFWSIHFLISYNIILFWKNAFKLSKSSQGDGSFDFMNFDC